MQKQTAFFHWMSRCTLLGVAHLCASGCEPKSRSLPQLDSDAGGATTSMGPLADSRPTRAAPGPEPSGADNEGEPSVGTLTPSEVTRSGGIMAPDAVIDAGGPVVTCVPIGPRDCASALDNDCDGQADNRIDDVCRCIPGTVEACNEHPGFDGLGRCVAGTRTCVATTDAGSTASDWSDCVGAVGPGAADTCSVAGDDTNCNGLPNEGCTCVDGRTQQCGSTTDIGVCAFGISTCANGAFGECIGATPPAARDSCVRGDDANCNGVANEGCSCIDGDTRPCGPAPIGICRSGVETCVNGAFSGECVGAVSAALRNCASPADNDCDGQPDNTIDATCRCTPGTTQVCDAHPQDGVGVCRPGSQQCSLGQGNTSSAFGACVGSVAPGPRNCASAADNDCDGEPDDSIDGICECVPGQGNGPCSNDPSNARCNGQGACVPCQTDGDCSLVAGGLSLCSEGECVSPAEPFVCGEDSPPPAPLPSARSVEGVAPDSTGGTITNGQYVLTQVDVYGEFTSVPGEGLEFRDGFIQRRHTTYLAATGAPLTGFSQVGTYTSTGTSLAVDMTNCQPVGTGREIWGYSANVGSLQLTKVSGQVISVETYLRQP